jgi:phosphopantothenoylcysteine decarboxylase/phosphopantothenate--cysteine ligase
MGYAIAEAARDAGHRVTLISGPVSLEPPRGVRTIHVISAEQMAKATARAFRAADGAIFSAAVSDYRPARRNATKLPKSRKALQVELKPTADIAASMGRIKGKRVTIGFALEDQAGRRHAEKKLRAKRFDGIVLNSPAVVGSNQAMVEFFDGRNWEKWPRLNKKRVAERIVEQFVKLWKDRPSLMTRDVAR